MLNAFERDGALYAMPVTPGHVFIVIIPLIRDISEFSPMKHAAASR